MLPAQRRFRIDAPHALSDLVVHALRRSPYFSRQVHVEVAGTEVLLTGTVSSYFHKQMAQEALRPVVGVSRVINGLAVVRG